MGMDMWYKIVTNRMILNTRFPFPGRAMVLPGFTFDLSHEAVTDVGRTHPFISLLQLVGSHVSKVIAVVFLHTSVPLCQPLRAPRG